MTIWKPTDLRLALTFSAALLLSGCFEVEGGPVLPGGDTVPGLEGELNTVVMLDPREEDGMGEFDPEEYEHPYEIRRAANGFYFVERYDGSDDDHYVLSAHQLATDTYVVEFIGDEDSSVLGILDVDRAATPHTFYLCIDMPNADNNDLTTQANAIGLTSTATSYNNVKIEAGNPNLIFAYMGRLWNDSGRDEWQCEGLQAEQD